MKSTLLYLLLITTSSIIQPMPALRRGLRLARTTLAPLRTALRTVHRRHITTHEAYKVFGFDDAAKKPSISAQDAKTLYHGLQFLWHVDHNPHSAAFANQKSQEINAAYKIILDDQRGVQYSNFDIARQKKQLETEYKEWKEYEQFKQKKEEELRQQAARRQKQKRAIAFTTSGIMGLAALTYAAQESYKESETQELHQAIQDSDTATIQKKCSSKTIINTKNKVGDTPLIAALKKGESAIALQLIEAGADLSITDADNNGPLLWASAKGLNAVVQRIFPTIHTAERTAVDGKGNTALHNAVLFGHTDTAFLLAAQPEIDISARNATGKTALQLAADSGNEVLFSHLLDIADKKNLGDAVASDQQNSSVHTLWNSFTAQAQVEKIDSDGYFKHRDKYKKLILTNQMGVNQEVSYNKSTLLSFAADEQDYEMVSLLLKKKANPSLKNNWNSTAFHYINTAAMAQLFLQADIDINQKGHNNWTLLHGASSNNNYALCEWLLRNGAQVDARDENDMSPVFLAHTVQIVQLFKKYNASLTIQDKWGNSLLHYAMRPEYDPKLILEYTELNPKKLQGNEGNTPWHELAQYCEKTSEKDLVAKVDYYLPYGKSSLTQKNMRLETPAETAKCWRESRCKTLAQVFIQLASEKPA